MRDVTTDDAPALEGLPISQAIVHGDTVYTSGIVPRDPGTGDLLNGDMTVQAEQVMANLDAILAAAGSSLDRVLKATVFLADVEDRPAFNAVYADHLGEPYPARSAVGVDLAVETGVEMECVAALE
jgi:2-iminobutanoate/2-iminopropanoate deaminase